MLIALLVVGAGLSIATVAAPFVLPWARRGRWWVMSSGAAVDPWGLGAGLPPSTRVDAVTITDIDTFLEVAVQVTSAVTGRVDWLRYPSARSDGFARLECWAAKATALFLVAEPGGPVSLQGPEVAVDRHHPGHPGRSDRADAWAYAWLGTARRATDGDHSV